jgi:hypothetical protein
MFKKTLKNFWSMYNPKNKQEAQKLLEATNAQKSAINFVSLQTTDKDLDNVINMVKLIETPFWKISEAQAQKYGIPNNAYIFENPMGKIKMNAIEWTARNVYQGAKATWNAAKAAPGAIKNAAGNAMSGLNFTGKALKNQYNKDFSSFPYDKPAESDYFPKIPKMDSDAQFKLQIEKNYYLNDIGNPAGQIAQNINNGLSNSAGVSDQLITVAQNVPSFNFEALAALGNLGSTGSVFGAIMGMVTGLVTTAAGAALGGAIGNAMKPGVATGIGTSITDMPYWLDTSAIILHNGGQVPGQGEVPTILKGGETVRTKAQEEELKQKLYDKYVGNFIPTACGESTQPQRQQESAPAQNKPIHQQITKDDEIFILNIIYDAIERNRSGLRTLIQAL